MRRIRISKRQHRGKWWLEPLAPDPLDRDIVRAKQLARRASRAKRTPC